MKAEFLRGGKKQCIETEGDATVEIYWKREPDLFDCPVSDSSPESKYHLMLQWTKPGQTDLRRQDSLRVRIFLTDVESRRLAAKINRAVTQAVVAQLKEE